MSKAVCLIIQNGFNGEEMLQLYPGDNVNVVFIKKQIALRLQIAPICQQLVFDNHVIENDECCQCPQLVNACQEAFAADEKPCVTLSLIINTDAAYAQLKSPEVWARMEAVKALARIGSARSDLDAVLTAIDRDVQQVRLAAIEAVALAAPRGTLSARDALLRCLPSPGPVSTAAANALCSVADIGDASVVHALLQLLEQGDAQKVPIEYLRALGQLALRGDESAIQAAILCTKNVHAPVREEAVKAIAQLAPHGHEGSCQICVKLLVGDWQAGVTHAALGALEILAKAGDLQVSTALCTCIETQFEDLRFAALRLLTRVAPPGDQRANGIMQEYAQDLKLAMLSRSDSRA